VSERHDQRSDSSIAQFNQTFAAAPAHSLCAVFIFTGADMNLYTMVGSGIGSVEAAALSTRLAAWHDAMVAHERRGLAWRTGERCDEECPHAEAPALWAEARETFGARARELTFLRARAMSGRRRASPFLSASEPGGAARVEI
jgi:hypothetical protein